ncbi:Plasmodium exported protein (PHIST), unknown function [Plasmodium vivax]|nr:Plasmodium exported protein (PHIST), unknown function [Plasmodium vivax]
MVVKQKMAQVSSPKRRFCSPFLIWLLLFVVYVLPPDTPFSTKWGKSFNSPECPLKSRRNGCRNLAEFSKKVKSFFFGNILGDDEPVKYPPKPGKKDAFKSEAKASPKHVCSPPNIYLTSTGSAIFTNKKKACVEFYRYIEDQKEKYNELVKALSEAFQVAATEEGMSDEDRTKIFNSCYPSIKQDAVVHEGYWKTRILLLLKRKIIWLIQFERFLQECNDSWDELIARNEKKWIEILTDKLRKYNMEKKKGDPSTEENQKDKNRKKNKLKKLADKISIDIYIYIIHRILTNHMRAIYNPRCLQ